MDARTRNQSIASMRIEAESAGRAPIAPWVPSQIPYAWFTPVMGTCGLAMVWRKGGQLLGISAAWSYVPFAVSVALFAFAAISFVLAWRRFPHVLRDDWRDASRINSFATITLSIILISTYLAGPQPAFAAPLWFVGIVGHLALTLVALRRWIDSRSVAVTSLGPVWFMPIVGHLLIPVAGVELGYVDISWFCFAIGIAFWPLLLGLILNRLFFHEPLGDDVRPTMFILLSPPAVAYVAYVRLIAQVDQLAVVLLDLTLFTLLFLTTLVPRLMQLRFTMVWWSFSFPMTAASVAMIEFAQATGGSLHRILAVCLLVVCTAIVAGLSIWTTRTLIWDLARSEEGPARS